MASGYQSEGDGYRQDAFIHTGPVSTPLYEPESMVYVHEHDPVEALQEYFNLKGVLRKWTFVSVSVCLVMCFAVISLLVRLPSTPDATAPVPVPALPESTTQPTNENENESSGTEGEGVGNLNSNQSSVNRRLLSVPEDLPTSSKPVDPLEEQVREYYFILETAFALADPVNFARLFDDSLEKPMNKSQVFEWATKFFAEHGPAKASTVILKLAVNGTQGRDRFGVISANALCTIHFAVKTFEGQLIFEGAETDVLFRREPGNQWRTAAWTPLPPFLLSRFQQHHGQQREPSNLTP
jgi:hypothetical protein